MQEPVYSKQAQKYLEILNKKSQQRLKKGIEIIPEGDIAPYKNHEGYFRLRIGNFRVIFKWLGDEQILISTINVRGQVYKGGN